MKSFPPTTLIRILLATSAVFSLCSCSTTRCVDATAVSPVRNVDYRHAPAMKELAAHARTFGNEMYPKVCALLLDETAHPPAQFDIVFKPTKTGDPAWTSFLFKRIVINSAYFTNQAIIEQQFDKSLVHELAHVATQTRHWTAFAVDFRSQDESLNWGESIANYAFYKLIGADGWYCPQCNMRFPHYTSGYSCGGAFLLYLEANHGTNLVRQLVRTVRRHADVNQFLEQATGKPMAANWAEFQTTPAFTPAAREMWKLRLALGYTNTYEPPGLLKRFDRYVEQHADPLTKEAIQHTRKTARSTADIDSLLCVYAYFNQPGGSAEQFIFGLSKAGKLPGMSKGVKGGISICKLNLDDFPNERTVECWQAGDKSRYHYAVSRATPDSAWHLDKAWRTGPDGKVMEEYPEP